jgi:hypothetical protein
LHKKIRRILIQKHLIESQCRLVGIYAWESQDTKILRVRQDFLDERIPLPVGDLLRLELFAIGSHGDVSKFRNIQNVGRGVVEIKIDFQKIIVNFNSFNLRKLQRSFRGRGRFGVDLNQIFAVNAGNCTLDVEDENDDNQAANRDQRCPKDFQSGLVWLFLQPADQIFHL